MVIGPKGATIKEIIETSGVDNIVVDGDAAVVTVSGFDDDKIQAALDRIEAIAGLGGGTVLGGGFSSHNTFGFGTENPAAWG